jgi:hypothetical protein
MVDETDRLRYRLPYGEKHIQNGPTPGILSNKLG